MADDDPLSIRTNNPGAQWYGPVAQQYGATDSVSAAGGNNAAVFPDAISGAAAQFGLLSKNYAGMPLSDAITKWSGGNSAPQYASFIAKQTGLSPDTVLTPELLASPQGLALAKAQAHWEAGRPYPLSDEQWATAQSRGLGLPNQSGGAGGTLPVRSPPAPVASATASNPTGLLDMAPATNWNRVASQLGQGAGMLNSQPIQPAAAQAMQRAMQLPNGTPAAQAMRQALLSRILQR